MDLMFAPRYYEVSIYVSVEDLRTRTPSGSTIGALIVDEYRQMQHAMEDVLDPPRGQQCPVGLVIRPGSFQLYEERATRSLRGIS